jgi:hypothetical protein
LDTDGDGKVDAAELAATTIAAADADGDGKLNAGEIAAAAATRVNPPPVPAPAPAAPAAPAPAPPPVALVLDHAFPPDAAAQDALKQTRNLLLTDSKPTPTKRLRSAFSKGKKGGPGGLRASTYQAGETVLMTGLLSKVPACPRSILLRSYCSYY